MKRLLILLCFFIGVSASAKPQSFFMLAGTQNGGGGGGGSTGVDTLASQTVSGAATITINMTAYYNQYRIIEIFFYHLTPTTGNPALNVLVSANGSTYDNATNNYTWFWGNNAGFTSANSGSGDVSATILGGGGLPTAGADGYMVIFNPGSSAFNPAIRGDMVLRGNPAGDVDFAFQRQANQVTEGVQILCAGGSTLSGSILVVGAR